MLSKTCTPPFKVLHTQLSCNAGGKKPNTLSETCTPLLRLCNVGQNIEGIVLATDRNVDQISLGTHRPEPDLLHKAHAFPAANRRRNITLLGPGGLKDIKRFLWLLILPKLRLKGPSTFSFGAEITQVGSKRLRISRV
jgi:hypothetical protein